MSTLLSDIKTIMQFDVQERVDEQIHRYGIVSQEKKAKIFNEEGLNWTVIKNGNKCPGCSRILTYKKEAQKGYRILENCKSCGITKTKKERVRKFIRISPIEGDDEKKTFNETYSNKEIRMHTLYQSLCIIYNCFLGWPNKVSQEAESVPCKGEFDDGFQKVKSRKMGNKISTTIDLQKLISLLPGRIIAYYGIMDVLARWRTEDDINLIALRIGKNIYISHGRKVSRDCQRNIQDKTYDLVTSTLRGVSLCLIAEIDERMDNGEPRELKEYAERNEGQYIKCALSVAIKMKLGNIRKLKITYGNSDTSEDNYELVDGIFISDKKDAKKIDVTDKIASAFIDLADVLDEILKATESGHSFYSITKTKGDKTLKIQPIPDQFDKSKCLQDFQKLLKSSSH